MIYGLFLEKLNQIDYPLFGLEEEAPDYRQKPSKSKGKNLSLEEFEDDIVIL